MKKLLAIVLVCLLAMAAVTGCASQKTNTEKATEAAAATADSANKTKISFVLDWTPNTNHTGLYVAKEKGYFDEAGLDIEIVQPPEDGAEMLVGSGKAQFGVSFQDYLPPALSGEGAIPITAVAALVQHNTSGIISLKGKGIDRPKGLEGKKYATWDLPIEKATLKKVVEDDGGDFSKVEMIPSTVTDEVSALQSGTVDAIWVYYGWAGIATEQAKLDTDFFAFKDIDPVFDYYSPVVIGNNDWIAKNPDATKAFLAALKKGYEYAIDDPDGAADILLKNAPELNAEQVKASQKYLSKEYKSDVTRWGYIDPARWSAFFKWINDNKLSEAEVPENGGFTNDYLPE
nr:ABC transporter substrate-binding protein [uncultured Ruminococcus sp.]